MDLIEKKFINRMPNLLSVKLQNCRKLMFEIFEQVVIHNIRNNMAITL